MVASPVLLSVAPWPMANPWSSPTVAAEPPIDTLPDTTRSSDPASAVAIWNSPGACVSETASIAPLPASNALDRDSAPTVSEPSVVSVAADMLPTPS